MKLGNRREDQDILNTPKLKENPFNLPQAYFRCLEEEVNAKIRTEEVTGYTVRDKSMFGMLKASFALVVVFAIVIGFGYLALELTNTRNINNEIELSEQIVNVSVEDKDSNNIPHEEDFGVKNTNTIKQEDIEQYLIESNMSIITLASLE